MAIQKDEAGRLSTEEEATLQRAEEEIDRILDYRFIPDHPAPVKIALTEMIPAAEQYRLNEKVKTQLAAKYMSAGWSVRRGLTEWIFE